MTATKNDDRKFEELASKEWLVTNGIGGFAAGTLSGANTRRYHGILVAALQPPTHRTVLVSKMEETIITEDGSSIELSSNEYRDAIHPTGFRFLTSFERDPLPTFHFTAEQHQLRKMIFMPFGTNSTVIRYNNPGSTAYTLRLRLFLNHRDYHYLTREDRFFTFNIAMTDNGATAISAFPGAVPLFFNFNKGVFIEQRDWYRLYLYRHETYRGLDDSEDLFTPGYIELSLEPNEDMFICFTTDKTVLQHEPADILDQEVWRINQIKQDAVASAFGKAVAQRVSIPGFDIDEVTRDLAVAADQFIATRESSGGKTIIAGYHWFTDWGRDTMIAMRGLVIARGDKELAESIIRTFLQYLDKGMLPNRFPDQGEEPEYNTIDATLWLFIVLHEYAAQFDDYTFIDSVFDSLSIIIECHIQGTRYNIHMLDNGLLYGGEDGVQLTWMDAKVGDYVVTPRRGCAVEINALWYNALMIYNVMAEKCKREPSPFTQLAEKVKASFHQHFFNGRYLYDVVIPGTSSDDAIRPNQVYAISLPYALLSAAESELVLRVVKEKLVTPYGLRSLDPEHPDFVPVYGGDQWHRDKAYHQGTVWSYLIGEYWLALLRLQQNNRAVRQEVANMMVPLLQHFYSADCIHGINEIFDGMDPKEGRGCVQQAWSVGMLLRVLQELTR